MTVDGLSAETIDGSTTRILRGRHEFIRIMSDGTNWRIIATGVHNIADGTATFPSIYAEDDTDTGLFFGTGIIGATVGGVEMLRIKDGIISFENASPKAWLVSLTALQIGGMATLSQASSPSASDDFSITNNAYKHIGGTWKRIINDEVSRYHQTNGVHTFQYAAAGAADSDIMWIEALALDASGDATFAGLIATGGETAPDVDAGGLCLNHGANDGNVLTFKNSDVAHGMTDDAETDTYVEFNKRSVTAGGLDLVCYMESGAQPCIRFSGIAGAADTTKDISALAPIQLASYIKSGTGKTSVGANGNLAVISDQATVRFIFDADGDSHQDVGTLWTNFDDEDDALAVRGLMGTLEKNSAKKHLYNMLKYNAPKLHDMGVITFTPKDKSPSGKDEMFLSNKGILGLYGGAISELYGVAELMAQRLGTSYKAMQDEYRKGQLKNEH